MLGPFNSIQGYCETLTKADAAQCAPGRSRFARGWQRGQRGPVESATTLVVNRKLGPHAIQTCHVVLQTKQGFFVSADATICDGQAAGEQRKTQLDSLHWLDQVGHGILAVNSQRLRRVRVDEARWWGRMYSESDVSETDSQLCGMTPSGTPACTVPLATSCGQVGLPLQFQGNELVSTAPAEARTVCSGELLTAGRYRLPFTGLSSVLPVPSAQAEQAEQATPAPFPLVGPFTSLQHYCLDPATTLDPFSAGLGASDEDTGLAFNDDEEPNTRKPAPYRWIADPLSNEARCDRRPGPWSGRSLRANATGPGSEDALVAVDLLSMKGSMAGAPIQMCRVALTTKAGVFVEDSTSTCQGVIGPDSKVHTRVLNLRWLDAPNQNRIARLDIEQVVHERSRWTMLCGVGASGIPSCARNYPLQCMNDDGATVALDLRVEAGFVHLTPSTKPPAPELQSYADCAQYRAPLPLRFP